MDFINTSSIKNAECGIYIYSLETSFLLNSINTRLEEPSELYDWSPFESN